VFVGILHISSVVIYYTDALVIGAALPIGVLTYYAIAANLSDYARQLVAAIGRVVTPRASALSAAGGSTAVQELILSTGAWATLLTVPMALTFLLRGERFIELWMGPQYSARAAPVLWLLAIVVWFAGGRSVIGATLMGLNRHRGLAAAYVAEATLNLALSVALVRPLGLPGVALGTVIPSVAVSLGFFPRYTRRCAGIPVTRVLYRVWGAPSLACLPFAAATYAIERWVGADSLASYFAQVLALVPLVGAGALGFGVSPPQRAALVRRLRFSHTANHGDPATPGRT
jgi:O-antigen/teichoic acid export membrane protein